MIKASTFINKDELKYLKELYVNSPKQFHTQDVNLFNVYKANIKTVDTNLWDNIQSKLIEFHGKRCSVTNYFLEYQVGAYAKNHKDNPDTVDGTAITLLDKSEDLIGGDIVVGRRGRQRILPQEKGQTIYYTTAVDHGVTEVIQGKRLVLITWFRKETWQN